MPLSEILGQEPIRIVRNGQHRWLFADGTEIPAIAGGAEAPAGDPPAPPKPPDPPAGDPPKEEVYDQDRAMATIRKLRDGEKTAKVQAQELATLKAEKAERERTEQEASDAAAKQRGEFEKLADAEKARATKLEGELATEREARKADRVQHQVITAAQKLGAVNPGVVYRLLDLSQVEYGDDGAPKNIDALLEALFKAEPYLRATTAANGTTVPATPTADNGKAMSQQELEDHRKRTERSYALRF